MDLKALNSYKQMIYIADNELFKDYLNDFKIILNAGWFSEKKAKEDLIKFFKKQCEIRGVNYDNY